MLRKMTGVLVGTFAVAALFLIPGAAQAEIDFGVRGGVYNDADAAFLGAELLTPFFARGWYFNPNVEYVFVDDGNLWTLNLDAHYDLRTGAPFNFWLGGGPAIIFQSSDCRRCENNDDTNVGLNLLAGLGFMPRAAIRPYVQGKFTLSDETEASIAFGLRFP
jgi:hypothetical protein